MLNLVRNAGKVVMKRSCESKASLSTSFKKVLDRDWSVEVEEAHEAAQKLQADTYVDPETGYMVFTEGSHIKRGKCCGNLCRHCPYKHVNVPQRKRERLQRKVAHTEEAHVKEEEGRVQS